MAEDRMLIAAGVTHRTAGLTLREKLAVLSKDRLDGLYAALQAQQDLRECVVLSTCNRLEVFAVVRSAGASADLPALLAQAAGLDPAELDGSLLREDGAGAARHLFEIAASLDSQIVGETEILGQVKDAYAAALGRGATGPVLNRLFQKAMQSAKWIRTHTAIGQGQVSSATVAVDLAEKIFGDLNSARILVVGAGEIGARTAKALVSRSARRLTILSRTLENAQSLAADLGSGVVEPLEALPTLLHRHDIVVSSTAAPHPILPRSAVESARHRATDRPLFLIDLAMPRDIEAAAGDLPDVYLYNLEDLARIAEQNIASRQAELARCRSIAADKAQHCHAALGLAQGNPTSDPPRHSHSFAPGTQAGS